MTVWSKYLLLQIPGWLLAAILLAALHHWLHFPLWAAVSVWIVYVAKDFLLYPFLRRAYQSNGKAGPEALVGLVGTATQALAPEGYVRVQGELWQARAEPKEKLIPTGTRVRVVAAEGLTLNVTEDTPSSHRSPP